MERKRSKIQFEEYTAARQVVRHKTRINLMTAEYADIIRFAEARGFVRSPDAASREQEEGSVGQYGLTLDEAAAFVRNLGLEER